MLILTLKIPGKDPEEIRVNHSPFRIGRADDNDLVLDGEQISTVHAEISEIDDVWVFKDNNSTNGLWIDGKRVEQLPIHTTTELYIGPIKIQAMPGAEWLQQMAAQAETAMVQNPDATQVMSAQPGTSAAASTPISSSIASPELKTATPRSKEAPIFIEPQWSKIAAWSALLATGNTVLLYLHSSQDLLVSIVSSIFMVLGSALVAAILAVFSRMAFKNFRFRTIALLTVAFGCASVLFSILIPFIAPWFKDHENFVTLERAWAFVFDLAFFYFLLVRLTPKTGRQRLAAASGFITIFFFLGGETIRSSDTLASFRYHRNLPLKVKSYQPKDFNKTTLFEKFDESLSEVASDRSRTLASSKSGKKSKLADKALSKEGPSFEPQAP